MVARSGAAPPHTALSPPAVGEPTPRCSSTSALLSRVSAGRRGPCPAAVCRAAQGQALRPCRSSTMAFVQILRSLTLAHLRSEPEGEGSRSSGYAWHAPSCMVRVRVRNGRNGRGRSQDRRSAPAETGAARLGRRAGCAVTPWSTSVRSSGQADHHRLRRDPCPSRVRAGRLRGQAAGSARARSTA